MYQKHSDTSRAAYYSMDAQRDNVIETVFDFIKGKGPRGVTSGWVAKELEMDTNTSSPRLVELEESGRILRLERREDNPSGRPAHIYVAACFRDQLAPGEKVLQPKPRENKTGAQLAGDAIEATRQLNEAKDILRTVESYIALGWALPSPESVLHKRIKALVGAGSRE